MLKRWKKQGGGGGEWGRGGGGGGRQEAQVEGKREERVKHSTAGNVRHRQKKTSEARAREGAARMRRARPGELRMSADTQDSPAHERCSLRALHPVSIAQNEGPS